MPMLRRPTCSKSLRSLYFPASLESLRDPQLKVVPNSYYFINPNIILTEISC